MRIRVLFFAIARERVGLSERSLELPEGATLIELQRRLSQDHPGISELLSICRFSVNSEYANPDQELPAAAEVAVIPPVSGGSPVAGGCIHADIVRTPIDMGQLASKVSSPGAGATLTFAGTVRADGAQGNAVVRITYEGYEPMAREKLCAIAARAASAHGVYVAVEHRLGDIAVGEISIGIAVSSPHRPPGFAALREIIENVKKELPVWKKEEFSNGASVWVDPQH